MSEQTTMTCDEILQATHRLGRIPRLNDDLFKRLDGIYTGLNIIAQTPNAVIGEEALQVFAKELNKAKKHLIDMIDDAFVLGSGVSSFFDEFPF